MKVLEVALISIGAPTADHSLCPSIDPGCKRPASLDSPYIWLHAKGLKARHVKARAEGPGIATKIRKPCKGETNLLNTSQRCFRILNHRQRLLRRIRRQQFLTQPRVAQQTADPREHRQMFRHRRRHQQEK
jgi:hypothetical protein